MFESLDETIRHDAHAETSSRERITKALLISVLSVLLFGGVYLAIRLMNP